MKVNLSEFSYGYAVTEELIYWRGTTVTAAPYFPSLYIEGQAGAGFDVMINRPGTPLFIQFKLAEYIKQLSNRIDEERKGYEVRYVAPIFHRSEDLNEHYLDRTVCENSIFFSPLDIGRFSDNKEH